MSTWHYGVVAQWWAEFNHGGPEVEYFRPFVAAGQPALDAGCGTGRLLLPYLREGLDVDGCDVSPDMLALCRAAAEREGMAPALHAQALHELELPRRYRTIVCCGTFGLGSTRAQEVEALTRFHDHLVPGGMLALDAEAAPYGTEPRSEPDDGPPVERRRGSGGAEYALRSRVVEYDRDARQVTLAMRAWMWRDGELVADEERVLTESFYGREELVSSLERAGFADVDVRGGYHGGPPNGEEEMLVYLARRPLM